MGWLMIKSRERCRDFSAGVKNAIRLHSKRTHAIFSGAKSPGDEKPEISEPPRRSARLPCEFI
jgi:hypothetical protein